MVENPEWDRSSADQPVTVEDAERHAGQTVLCEVNGLVVLARNADGELVAPEGLEGIAAYFEAKGTPEDLGG